MTKTIKLTLTNAVDGIWTQPASINLGTGERTPPRDVATGVTISANRDYGALCDALQPHIVAAFGTETDAMVECYDPNAKDLDGQPDSDAVVLFRIIDGEVTGMS